MATCTMNSNIIENGYQDYNLMRKIRYFAYFVLDFSVCFFHSMRAKNKQSHPKIVIKSIVDSLRLWDITNCMIQTHRKKVKQLVNILSLKGTTGPDYWQSQIQRTSRNFWGTIAGPPCCPTASRRKHIRRWWNTMPQALVVSRRNFICMLFSDSTD